MTEFEDAKTVPTGYMWTDQAEYLLGLGYKVLVSEWQPLQQYGSGHAWQGSRRYPCELHNPAAWGNLIAAREAELFNRIELGFQSFERRRRRWAPLRRLKPWFVPD